MRFVICNWMLSWISNLLLYSYIDKDCGRPPLVPHARITYTLTDVTTFRATVSYICADLGYKLHGPSSILCTGDGRWAAAPLCLSKMMKINLYILNWKRIRVHHDYICILYSGAWFSAFYTVMFIYTICIFHTLAGLMWQRNIIAGSSIVYSTKCHQRCVVLPNYIHVLWL